MGFESVTIIQMVFEEFCNTFKLRKTEPGVQQAFIKLISKIHIKEENKDGKLQSQQGKGFDDRTR